MRHVTRALVGFVRGGSHPRSVAWAVYLGVLAGFVTGTNLTLAVLLLLVILLDVRTRVFLLAWAGGFALSWPLIPVTFRIGQFLLDRTPLGSLLGRLGEAPLIALLDWDRYALVGGAALAALGALPAASAAARFVQSRRDIARAAAHRDVDFEAAARGSDSPAAGFRRGLLLRMILGSDLSESAGPLGTPDAAPRLLRPLGAIAFPVAVAIVVVLPYWIGPTLVGRALLARFSELNGADVEAVTLHLSLSDGRFDLSGLAIADPVHLSRDRLRVERIHGKLRPGAILRGRLEIERVELDGLRSNVARRLPARPFDGHAPTFDADHLEPPSDFFLGSLIPSSGAPARAKELRIDRYLRSWPRLREQLDLLSALAHRLEVLREADASSSRNLLAPGGTANLWARRSPLGQSRPLVRVHHLRADSLPPAWGFGSAATLELTAVTSRPSLESDPTRLVLVAPQMGADVNAAFQLRKGDGRHELRFLAHQLDLADLVDRRASRGRFTARDGTLSVIGGGWVDRQGLELALEVDAAGLDVELLGERPVAGLTTQMWNEGLNHLGRFYARVLLRGDWNSPELVVDSDHLVQQFKHQLRAAGAHQLVDTVEAQLAAADDGQLGVGARAGQYGVSTPGEIPLSPAPTDGEIAAGDAEPLDMAGHDNMDRAFESAEGREQPATGTLAGAHQPRAESDIVWPPRDAAGAGPGSGAAIPQIGTATRLPQPQWRDPSIAENGSPVERAVDPRRTSTSAPGWPTRGASPPPARRGMEWTQPPSRIGWTPPGGAPGWAGPGSTVPWPPPGPIQMGRGYDGAFQPAMAAAQPWMPGMQTTIPRLGAPPVGGPYGLPVAGQLSSGQTPASQQQSPRHIRAVPWPTQFYRWARRVMGSDTQSSEGESADAAQAVPAIAATPAQPTVGAPLPSGPYQPAQQTVRRYEPGPENWYEQLWR